MKVVHCKRDPFDVYIGRPARGLKGSIWANPFHIGKDGTREDVIEKYRQYILSKPELLKQLESLRGKVLGCWCSPERCHGDVLVELLREDYMLQNFTDEEIEHELLETGYLYLGKVGRLFIEKEEGKYILRNEERRETTQPFVKLRDLLFCEYITFDDIRHHWKYHGVLLDSPKFQEKIAQNGH